MVTPVPVSTARVCVACGHPFTLSLAAVATFAMREVPLPKRCWPCRRQHRPAPPVTVYVAPEAAACAPKARIE